MLVEGTLKLIDLGLAKMMKHKATSVTCDTMAGTVDYISPEAFLERDEDDKIKVYLSLCPIQSQHCLD